MNKYLRTVMAIRVLRKQYEVIGGEIDKEEKARREYYYMYDMRYHLRAVPRKISMLSIEEDSYDDLPLFMMNLGDGIIITCYSIEEQEEEMNRIAEQYMMKEKKNNDL